MQKAKEAKGFAEKLITLAKDGTLSARRRAIALLGNRDIIEYEDNRPIKKGTIIGKLFSELGPRYLDRAGGYTRIIRLSLPRLGDNGQLVLLQLIGPDEHPKKESKTIAKRRSRRKGKERAQTEDTAPAEESAKAEQTAGSEESDENSKQ